MQKWVSDSIAPLCVLLLFFYVILYFASDLISKGLIKIVNICIIILMVFFAGIGCYAIALGATAKLSDMQASWDILSAQSKTYYYDNSISTLLNTYVTKMVVTGALYVALLITGVIIIIFSYQFLGLLTNEWRPPLRARLSDERAKRYIDYYSKYNKDYKKLYQMENFVNKSPEVKKVDNIIDNSLPLQIEKGDVNNILLNQNLNNKYEQVNKKENDDQFEIDENNLNNLEDNNNNIEARKNRRTVLGRRKKNTQSETEINNNQQN